MPSFHLVIISILIQLNLSPIERERSQQGYKARANGTRGYTNLEQIVHYISQLFPSQRKISYLLSSSVPSAPLRFVEE
ncbi:hypothetical protein KBT16_12700 [Nostoc sp. CCCryo 231-06]|nr:hypothetical protein [Nostoc sp. CCCryo 231-06]